MTAKVQRYLFTYRFEGAEYGFDIPAYSLDEAKRRLSAMGMARYDGELQMVVPVPGGSFFAKLLGWR